MSLANFSTGSADFLSSLTFGSASYQAGGITPVVGYVDGFSDSSGAGSTKPFRLIKGNQYRVVLLASGGGTIEVFSGGSCPITSVSGASNWYTMIGGSVVASASFSTGFTGGGNPIQIPVDLGLVLPTGSFDTLDQCAVPLLINISSGVVLAEVLLLPWGTADASVFTFGGDAPSGDATLLGTSIPTTGSAFSAANPFPGVGEAWYAVHGSTDRNYTNYGPFFPNIDLTVNGVLVSGVNSFGESYNLVGGTIESGLVGTYAEHYHSISIPDHPFPEWFDPGADGFVGPIWWTPGTNPCIGPPIFNTTHRSFQLDETGEGIPDPVDDDGLLPPVSGGGPPFAGGGVPFVNTMHRAYQPDEDVDGP